MPPLQRFCQPVTLLPHCVPEEIFLGAGITLYIYPYASFKKGTKLRHDSINSRSNSDLQKRTWERRVFGFLCRVFSGELLPSPERACPDTEGGGLGLGGKSDIMPCNLFLRFSEPGKRRETQNIQSCRDVGGMEWATDGQMTDRGEKMSFLKLNTSHTTEMTQKT